MDNQKSPRIKVVKNGPYLVFGNVKLTENVITSKEDDYIMIPSRTFQTEESYALCRCGQSKNMPFCDGSHSRHSFDGTETASRKPYLECAEISSGPDLILADAAELCAFARFCHTKEGNVWQLTRNSHEPESREKAIKAATECPAGRLRVFDKKTGEAIEPYLEPAISVIQDPQKGVSGPLWVQGGIPIEAADGEVYEIRNRVTLCRCGESENKPFCDAMHVSAEFTDV